MFQNLGEMLTLLGRTLSALRFAPRQYRKILEQLFEIGNASLLMACVLSLFIGGVLALQIGPTLTERGLGVFVGQIVGLSMCRELGPVMMAVLIAGRIGSAMAAEIGSMTVYQEIDALRTMNINPVQYLVLPRLVAISIALPILVVFAMGWFFDKLRAEKQATIDQRQPSLDNLNAKAKELDDAIKKRNATQKVVDQCSEWIASRFEWMDLVGELRRVLEQTEANTRQPGIQTGLWIERLAAEKPVPKGFKITQDTGGGDAAAAAGAGGADATAAPGGDAAAKPVKSPVSTNTIQVINLTCRGVSWHKLEASADDKLAIELLNQLNASAYFAHGTNGTELAGQMEQDEATGTFKFDVKLKLAKPIKL